MPRYQVPAAAAVPLAVTTTMIAWASAFVVIRAVGPDLRPGPLTLGRLLVASVLLGGLLLARRGWVRPDRREWALVAGCGIAWFGIYNLALNAAERSLDAGTTAMLVNVGPLLIAVLAGTLLGEGMTARLLVGGAVAFAGIVVIAVGSGTVHVDSTTGVLLCLLAAAAYAVGVVLQKVALRRLPALQVTWTAATVAVIGCLPFLPALRDDLARAPSGAVLGMVYLGAVPTALAFTTWAYALARVDASRLGMTTYVVPVIVVLMAWLLLSETPTWAQLAGGAVVLTGVALSRTGPRPRAGAVPDPVGEIAHPGQVERVRPDVPSER